MQRRNAIYPQLASAVPAYDCFQFFRISDDPLSFRNCFYMINGSRAQLLIQFSLLSFPERASLDNSSLDQVLDRLAKRRDVL